MLIASKLEAELICAERGAELAEIAQRVANDDHHDLIIAAGGDGSVNAVAAAVTGTTKTMAVLPLGTVNHFAKTLGMPMDLASAIESLVDAETTMIDLGEVNGIPFVNNSTLGVYPRIVRFREQLRARYGLNKWLAFAYATARMLPRRDPLRLKIVVDGDVKEELNVETTFVFIGKSDSTLGGLDLIPGARPEPGKLSVCFVRSGSRLSMLRLGARAMAGRLPGAEGFEAFQAADLVITTEPDRLHVAMDGEVITPSTPLHYRVRPGALRVAMPRRPREGERDPDEEPGKPRGEEPPCEQSSTYPTSTSAASTSSC